MSNFPWGRLVATIAVLLGLGGATYYFYSRESTSANKKPPKLQDLTNIVSGPRDTDVTEAAKQAIHESKSPH